MAEILLARSRGLAGFSRRVVIKRLLPELAPDPEYVTMFLDEARIAAVLEHPNIAQVYDIGQDDDGYFLVMEYIEGKNLRIILSKLEELSERMPLEHAVSIVLGVAAGLHAAHETCGEDGLPLGIVHRDVSPANVMVTFDGCVKLIDFGIAMSEGRETETQTGVLKGRPRYMAPEQILNQEVDRRADVFCLGVLLFELTTGTALLSDYDAHESLRRIVRGTVPRPSQRVPGYPAALEEIVMRAMQRNPADRYATAEHMIIALERFARDCGLSMSQHCLGDHVLQLFPTTPTHPEFDRAKTTRMPLRMPLRPRTDTQDSTSWKRMQRISAVEPAADHSGSLSLDVDVSAFDASGEFDLPADSEVDEERYDEDEADDTDRTIEPLLYRRSRASGTPSERLVAGALTAAIVMLFVGWAVIAAQ